MEKDIQVHPLICQLSKLRESSKEAVADSGIGIDDELKQYLHIEREVEAQLRNIIEEKGCQSGPSLVLVCGNVGDGKSHILSSLSERLAYAGYKVHNDATESFRPDQNCIDALDEVLDPFSDEKLGTVDCKQVVAINLGTLSNFLAEKGEKYKCLQSYTKENNIIDRQGNISNAHSNSLFSYINFADYHLFNLNKEGAEVYVVDALLEKVTAKTDQNPIYRAYQESCEEEWASDCVILRNYEFLMEERHRKCISNLILQLILKRKQIISIRHLLNFVFDLIIPSKYSFIPIEDYAQVVEKMTLHEQLIASTPYALFDNPSLSNIFHGLSTLDPCLIRKEKLDEEILKLNISENFFFEFLKSKGYNIPQDINQGKLVFSEKVKTYVRLKYFCSDEFKNSIFDEYVKGLFYFNTSNHRKLRDIHENVKDAIRRWHGNNDLKDKLMIFMDSTQNQYRVFRDQKINVDLSANNLSSEITELKKFVSEFSFKFMTNGDGNMISIDYSLYALLRKINMGYRPNKLDRANYIHFSKFVDQLTLAKSNGTTLYIDEINVDLDVDFELKVDEYGDFLFERAK